MISFLMVIGATLMGLGIWLIASGFQVGWYSRPRATVRDLLTDPDRIMRRYTKSPAMRQHIAFTEARTDWLAEHEAQGTLPQALREIERIEAMSRVYVRENTRRAELAELGRRGSRFAQQISSGDPEAQRILGTLPAGEYELHVQEQPTPVTVVWTPYDQAREAFVRSGSPSAKEAMLSHVRLPSDPNCTYPGCGGSGAIWDGGKLVECPGCG